MRNPFEKLPPEKQVFVADWYKKARENNMVPEHFFVVACVELNSALSKAQVDEEEYLQLLARVHEVTTEIVRRAEQRRIALWITTIAAIIGWGLWLF